jgi:hypothetical protein
MVWFQKRSIALPVLGRVNFSGVSDWQMAVNDNLPVMLFLLGSFACIG